MGSAAVFLDRDDTLIANRTLPPPPAPAAPGDLTSPDLVELLPGVLDACADLYKLHLPLIVVTNQGVVARGGLTLDGLEDIHDRLDDLLTLADGTPMLTAVYACPYHPVGTVPAFTREHPWRKPQPGMFLAAAEDHDLDLAASWMIGDASRDIEAALAAGLSPQRCLLVGESAEARFTSMPEAAQHIVESILGGAGA